MMSYRIERVTAWRHSTMRQCQNPFCWERPDLHSSWQKQPVCGVPSLLENLVKAGRINVERMFNVAVGESHIPVIAMQPQRGIPTVSSLCRNRNVSIPGDYAERVVEGRVGIEKIRNVCPIQRFPVRGWLPCVLRTNQHRNTQTGANRLTKLFYGRQAVGATWSIGTEELSVVGVCIILTVLLYHLQLEITVQFVSLGRQGGQVKTYQHHHAHDDEDNHNQIGLGKTEFIPSMPFNSHIIGGWAPPVCWRSIKPSRPSTIPVALPAPLTATSGTMRTLRSPTVCMSCITV